MHTTVELIDAAKAKLGVETDYRLAKVLGWRPSVVSNYRVGRSTLANTQAVQLARVLEIDAAYVLACANYERETDAEPRAAWLEIAGQVRKSREQIARLLRRAAAAMVAVGIGFSSLGAVPGHQPGASVTAEQCILRKIRRRAAKGALAGFALAATSGCAHHSLYAPDPVIAELRALCAQPEASSIRPLIRAGRPVYMAIACDATDPHSTRCRSIEVTCP